eukprot:268849_1
MKLLLLLLLTLSSSINATYFHNKEEAEMFTQTVVKNQLFDFFTGKQANISSFVWNQWNNDSLCCVQEECVKGIYSIFSRWAPTIGVTKEFSVTLHLNSYSENGLSLQASGHLKLFDDTECIGNCTFISYLNDDGTIKQKHMFCEKEFYDCFENGKIQYLGSKQIESNIASRSCPNIFSHSKSNQFNI